MELASEVPGNTLNFMSEQTMKDVFVGEIHTTRSHPKKSIDDFILIWYFF
jgi:hypothetical protein